MKFTKAPPRCLFLLKLSFPLLLDLSLSLSLFRTILSNLSEDRFVFRWHRDVDNVPDSEIHRFPYAVLTVRMSQDVRLVMVLFVPESIIERSRECLIDRRERGGGEGERDCLTHFVSVKGEWIGWSKSQRSLSSRKQTLSQNTLTYRVPLFSSLSLSPFQSFFRFLSFSLTLILF
jgi:hypothetical protein